MTIIHVRAIDLRGVGLLKISDGYLGPVLYARTRADPKSRLNSYYSDDNDSIIILI